MALIHGGDLESFYQEYQYEPLDFSANCNPLGVPPAVRSHQAGALAVAAEVEGQRGQPGVGRLLAHDLVVLLAAAGAVAHEQGALGPAGGQEEPAGQLDSSGVDGDRPRPWSYVLGGGRLHPLEFRRRGTV